jgi:hypothetical protein
VVTLPLPINDRKVLIHGMIGGMYDVRRSGLAQMPKRFFQALKS